MTKQEYLKALAIYKDHAGEGFGLLKWLHVKRLDGNGTAAVLLCFLLSKIIGKDKFKNSKDVLLNNDLFFKCPAKDIQETLGLTKFKQTSALNYLAKAGVVKINRRESLWIKVDHDGLDELVNPKPQSKVSLLSEEGTESKETILRKLRNYTSKVKKPYFVEDEETPIDQVEPWDDGDKAEPIRTNKNNIRTRPGDGSAHDPPPSESSVLRGQGGKKGGNPPATNGMGEGKAGKSKGMPLPKKNMKDMMSRKVRWPCNFAGEIYGAVVEKGFRITREKPNFDKWGESLRELWEDLVASKKMDERDAWRYLKDQVRYHLDHLGQPFQPEAFCPKTIRDKWSNIEMARKRREDPAHRTEKKPECEDVSC